MGAGNPRPHSRDLDLPGVAALTMAVFVLVPLIEGRESGWPAWLAARPRSPSSQPSSTRVQARGHAPLVPLGLLRQHPFVVGVALVIVLYAALNSFFLVLSLTLQDGLGVSALDAGLVYTPQGGAFFACSLLAGRFSRTYGRRILEIGALITAGDPRFTALAEALYAASPEFRFWWTATTSPGSNPRVNGSTILTWAPSPSTTSNSRRSTIPTSTYLPADHDTAERLPGLICA